MHPYSTDSNERKIIPFLIAGAAIATAWGLASLLRWARIEIPWWLDAPSALSIYGILYALLDRKLWRLSFLHRVGLVKVPILEGRWQGHITTSFDEHGVRHAVQVRITQTWTGLNFSLQGRDSKSHSLVAALMVEAPQGPVLSYQYLNEPLPQAKETMQIHYGTARLTLASSGKLNGEYYSGRGRQNVGSIELERVHI
jgi:hypothetical protein